MKTATVDHVMSWRPCSAYTRERVTELWAGREALSALDVLALDIPERDRLWAVLRPEMIDENDLHELACRFAEQSAPIWERWAAEHAPDKVSVCRDTIAVMRLWMQGEATGEVLAAARAAASAAARDAAWVASDAAWEAAWAAWAASDAAEAARAAAGAAASDAARAASDAARAAVGEEAPAIQIQIVRDLLAVKEVYL